MDETIVLRHLHRLHRDIETDAGKDPNLVADDVVPLEELGGFDSLLIPNVVRELARLMGLNLAKGARLRNPYVSPGSNQRLSLRAIAQRFIQLYDQKGRP